jgi:hypothetical protein
LFKGVIKDYKELLKYKLCMEKTAEGNNTINRDIELLDTLK